jgi:outer membrane protein
MRKRRILLPILSVFIFLGASAQDKWDLKRCVEFAWANNITVRQSDVQKRIGEVQLKQDKWARYPSASFSTNTGFQFGRSIDPTTNEFTTNQTLFQSFNFQAGVAVFNWHRLKNNVIASQYELLARGADVDKAKNDVALNVATLYLQVLLARKQADIARVQMEQSRNQMGVTRKKVEAGSLPEIDALTLESQYANDSSTYITTISTAEQNLLDLKAMLNLDAAAEFDILAPPVETIPIESLLDLQPDKVYETAMKNQPNQKANALRLQSFAALLKAVKATKYPTISIGGGLGTNFAAGRNISTSTFTGYAPSGPFGPLVNVGGVDYPILLPTFNTIPGKRGFVDLWDGWGTQIDNNFRQNIGLTINVPILNGGQAKFAYQRTKIDYDNLLITKEQIDQQLKNQIYKAYQQATAALQKYNATNTAVAATQKSYDFALKRFDLGLLNTFDLITSQNNLTKAKFDNALAQFEYVFRMKILEFWKGLGIRL